MKAFYRWLAAVAAAAILLLGLSSTAGAVTTKLKVAFMAGQPPFQFLDGEGRPVGMHIDILEAIAEECDLVLEYLPMETNSECLRALEEGRTDIVLGVMVSDKGYAGRMTSEITSSPLCMVVPNRILNENGELAVFPYKVVFQHGTADNYLVSSLGANQCIIVGSQREVMEAHLQGRAEVMVGVKNSILYQLRERGLMDDYTIHHNYMENVGYAIAVPEGDHSLRYLLNNGIASLRSSRRYETIWDKWIISDSSEKLRLLLRRGAVAGVAVGLAVLGYSVVNARVKKALKRQVEEKTREVTAANLELEKRVIQIENDSDLRNRIIKYAPVGIVLFDRDFRVTLANRSVCCLTGVSGDLTGRNVLDLPVVGKILQPISERVFDRDFSLKNGAFTYLSKPLDVEELRIFIRQALEFRSLSRRVTYLSNELKSSYGEMVGKSPAMQEVYRLIEKVKDEDVGVTISGESGTGKELAARAVHYQSRRKDEMFVAVNCAAIPEGLLEEEFFGHKKGSFTGALSDKKGKFELADKGTLFLDEIGDMPLSLQGKLLRVLQQKEFTPIGGTKSRKIDVRVIAATNRDLKAMIRQGSFRQDLYYRINVVELYLPPLRERKQDIPLLCDYFLRQYAEARHKPSVSLSEAARKLLLEYDYPGNIRELANILEYAFILTGSGVIDAGDLPINLKNLPGAGGGAEGAPAAAFPLRQQGSIPPGKRDYSGMTLQEIEREAIAQCLERNGGRQKPTAHTLGISERGLRNKIKQYGLSGR